MEPQLEGKRQEMLCKVSCVLYVHYIDNKPNHGIVSNVVCVCFYLTVWTVNSNEVSFWDKDTETAWTQWGEWLYSTWNVIICNGKIQKVVYQCIKIHFTWIVKHVIKQKNFYLSELQLKHSSGSVKGCSSPGRGRVRGDGRKLLGRTHWHRWVPNQLHGEENCKRLVTLLMCKEKMISHTNSKLCAVYKNLCVIQLCHSRRAKEEKLQQAINTHGQFPSSH